VFDGVIEFNGDFYGDVGRVIEKFVVSTMPPELRAKLKNVALP
jgi:hypothetical protein